MEFFCLTCNDQSLSAYSSSTDWNRNLVSIWSSEIQNTSIENKIDIEYYISSNLY